MHYTQVALQLYTVRDETRRDFEGTLRRVAQIGYTGVEFAGYGNLSARAMAALLAETGLTVAGTHVGLDGLTGEKLEASLNYCRAINCPVMVLPSLAQEWRTLDGIRALGPRLNSIGQRCRDEGIDFGYHNHDFEFTSIDGRTLLEHLLEITDPVLVKIELDVYWAAYAGHDPLALLNRLGKRVALIHFKDMAPDRSMTEVGKGILDLDGMTAFARQHGIWAVVEHDHPTLPSLESAKVSLEYFR
ncbi:MAG TPA: sugar phosphate isomerase/epimerase [Ktedonobacteraceae bacterium]|nr:sugar phosphate isomerase/epimerase [Ktedonobacteraceae bacterium]